MRPPKRPGSPGPAEPLGDVLAALRPRRALSGWAEFEALETGGHTVFITRFRKTVLEQLKDWEAAFPGYRPDWARAEGKGPDDLFEMAVDGSPFFLRAHQAYAAVPDGQVRRLLLEAHPFIPRQVRESEEYRQVALRVHLAGGSDQWAGREKLDRFLASGRDGWLSSIDWGQV